MVFLKVLHMPQFIQIAIDGPVAAGKGTVARLVAERLGILYVDTGAMYRVAALIALRQGVSWDDADGVAKLVGKAEIILRNPVGDEKDGRQTTVLVDGEDVSWKIRTEEVSKGSSSVARHKQVREALVLKQQELAKQTSVVMEGRDITYRVLPNALMKIFLTASEEVRAKRRHDQLLIRGEDVAYEDVLNDLKKRDEQDMNRAVDPLQVMDGVWVLDTTHMDIENVVAEIVTKVRSLGGADEA